MMSWVKLVQEETQVGRRNQSPVAELHCSVMDEAAALLQMVLFMELFVKVSLRYRVKLASGARAERCEEPSKGARRALGSASWVMDVIL